MLIVCLFQLLKRENSVTGKVVGEGGDGFVVFGGLGFFQGTVFFNHNFKILHLKILLGVLCVCFTLLGTIAE